MADSTSIFEPPDFLTRSAALVLKPRVNLTRFHSVLAPNSNHRIKIPPYNIYPDARSTTADKRVEAEEGKLWPGVSNQSLNDGISRTIPMTDSGVRRDKATFLSG